MMLKSLRVAAATLFFLALTLFFFDFTGYLPLGMHHLAEFQIVPALLTASAFSLGVVAVWLVLTLLFGRVYCSVVCPLGILQDFVAWFGKRFQQKHRYAFRKSRNLLRYGILAACVVGFLVDLHLVLSLLDPYSVYGRMANSLFRPIVLAANNGLALIVNGLGYYGIYLVPNIVSWPTVAVSVAMLLFVGYLSWRFGRRYCNTICPVGTLLGLFSRYSLFRIRLHKDCISCGLCEQRCKAECIDSKMKTVDVGRCVSCFNCLGACKRGSLLYGIDATKPAAKPKSEKSVHESTALVSGAGPVERRTFLGTLFAAIGASLGAVNTISLHGVSKSSYKKNHPITPPGSGNIKRFQQRCTACHLCVTKCPAHIIRPAVADYGLSGFLQPVISFENGFCNFDCVICSKVCPNHALVPLKVKEKHLLQIGKVHFIKENCIVDSQHTNCGACAEHCPTGAVKMIPFGKPEDALTIPEIDPDLCVGCGACESICPILPYRAIYVDGNPTHQTAKPAFDPTQKQQEVKLNDFGF